MKRIHISVGVADIDRSVDFYRTLFGVEPTVLKSDYAKWFLDDPRVNFSIDLRDGAAGVDHVGIQAETADELAEIQARLTAAEEKRFDQPMTECCYARSTKTWVRDPDDVTWETFVTHDQIDAYGSDRISRSTGCC